MTVDPQAGQPARKLGRGWEVIGPAECPIHYRRTILSSRWFKILWHRFLPNASDEAPHDHPRSFLTFVLRGGYDDLSPCPACRESECQGWELGPPSDDWRRARLMTPCPDCEGRIWRVDEVRAPTIRYRSAEHAHITKIGPEGAVTLVLMGRLRREWGFWRDGRWYPWRAFERKFGMNWRCP